MMRLLGQVFVWLACTRRGAKAAISTVCEFLSSPVMKPASAIAPYMLTASFVTFQLPGRGFVFQSSIS